MDAEVKAVAAEEAVKAKETGTVKDPCSGPEGET